MSPLRPLSLKARALRWLAQREHSRAELRRKLLRWDNSDASDANRDAADEQDATARVDELLDWLVANSYLDERRFVESRLHKRVQRFGNRRIESELKQHGVALAPADAQALEASELERAREVWARKFDRPAADAAGRARQARFLAGRGFSTEVILRVVRGTDADPR